MRAYAIPALLVALCAAAPASGAQGASALGSASASVVAPVTVAALADLDFGTLVVSAGGGTTTIAPLSIGASFAGGVAPICAAACPLPHPARFSVEGEPGRSYLVTVPPSVALTPDLPEGTGGRSFVVDGLTVGTGSRALGNRGALDARGRDFFEVGGTLHVPIAAEPARYTTQITVIVSYF